MLTWQSKIRMVNVFIHSKLDFCNSLLNGISAKQLNRLQKIQNSATRYIFGWKKRRGVTALRRWLHFLPVEARIHFKVCLLMHQVVHGYAPDYLTNEIQKRRPKSVNLRANNDKTLLEEKIHGDLKLRHKITERGISIAGPVIWNNLPRKIRQLETVNLFKKQLKTYLFVKTYGGSYSVI